MAKVKRLTSDGWSQFDKTPIDIPINKDYYEYPYFVTANVGLYPNNNNTFTSVGSITIPRDGFFQFKWGIVSWESDGGEFSYELRKNGSAVKSGTARNGVFEYSATFEQGDVVELFYKSTYYKGSSTTYYPGFGSGLICHYDWHLQ